MSFKFDDVTMEDTQTMDEMNRAEPTEHLSIQCSLWAQ